ncbi:hypothetical protein BJ165DRAFT_1614649 [Panaeolus papilionaceus]|nr:hypothetical protein BJ165DRAFT_1614649 [Panaeolus papilionaceus]
MSTATQEYRILKVNGPISIVPVTPKEVKGQPLAVFILMGPTGSGKSSFIESLAPSDQQLNISKDSLESVTQQVNCYCVINFMYSGLSCVMMDTPGFLDPRMSETRITSMITERLNAFRPYAGTIVVYILYFQPITDIRIGGSKWHSFKMLREYVKLYDAQYVNVITTMWNTLSTPKQLEDANHRFVMLQHEIYKSSDGLNIKVTKFDTSSKGSALSIIGSSFFARIQQKKDHNIVRVKDLQYQSLLCDNLLNRITTLLQQLQMIAEDKWTATTPGREDHCLLDVVLRDETVALASLQSFLDDFGSAEIGPAGMIALHSFLDTRYDQDPGACSSHWPLSRALVVSGIPSDPASMLAVLVAEGPDLDQLHIPPAPTPSALQHQPDTSHFAPLVASFKRRFNRTRR